MYEECLILTLGEIHNTQKGPIFDDNLKKEVDDKIAENYHLFNPLASYVDEKGDENPIMRHISISEIKKQLSKTKGRSASGQDCIRYTVLKQCPEIVFANLEQIYNICLQTGYFPEPWKQAMGTMIQKTNKNHKITTNYRPISLLSCIGKLFEKILANRIRGELEERKFFNQWQLGYRNKRCAMEHILRLTDDALTGLQANRLGVAVFIDVEKAFDSVWHNGLRYKLMNSELPNKIIRLMSSFISDRTITVKINDEMSDEVKLNAGTHQGSVLSPLLLLMYVNDIPVDPMNNQVKISQFADDLGLWTFGPNATYVQYRIHKTLSALEKWCYKWRIKLNAKKTQLIVLKKNGRQHKKNQALIIRRRNRSCGRSNLNLLRLLSGTNWGCKPKIIMQLYKQYVRPVLEYGAIALLSAPKTTLEKIQLVQNKAIKIAYRLPWCTSKRKIHQLAEIEPIKNRFQSLANKFIHTVIRRTLRIIQTSKGST